MRIRAMRDDFLDMLNLLSKGVISKEYYDDIIALYLRCSRGYSKTKMGSRNVSTRKQKLANGWATTEKNGNLLQNLKIDMMSSISA